MDNQLQQCLQDIIPGYHTPSLLPTEIITCAKTLYRLSLQKTPVLPKNSEIGRSHICAFLAVEKYAENYNLPHPDMSKVPLQPKLVDRIIHDFRENLLNQIRSPSPASSPVRRSPIKRLSVPLTPVKFKGLNSNPVSAQNSPRVSSPLKRLQALADEDENKKGFETPQRKRGRTPLHDVESPFNPKTPATPSHESPTKIRMVATSQQTSPSKLGKLLLKVAQDALPRSSSKYYQNKKFVSIPDLIAMANAFYIPSTYSPKLVESFLLHKHKLAKKSEWLLACGLVYAAYVRINQRILLQKIGAKLEFLNQLFQYQKGGLMKDQMLLWCDITQEWAKKEPWLRAIELQFRTLSTNDNVQEERICREGKEWHELLDRFGPMIHGDVLYLSELQTRYYNEWSRKLLQMVEQIDLSCTT